jgi:hypothetical protein
MFKHEVKLDANSEEGVGQHKTPPSNFLYWNDQNSKVNLQINGRSEVLQTGSNDKLYQNIKTFTMAR